MQSSESLDVSFLLHIFDIGCQKLKREGTDALRIFDIISLLNDAVTRSLEKDVDTGNELPFLLALAQITLEHLHSSIGYSYIKWFEVHISAQRLHCRDSRFFLLDSICQSK